jgi:hypothetical protein
MQLWEVHKDSNGLLIFNEAKSPSTKKPLTVIAKRNPAAKWLTEKIKVYSKDELPEMPKTKLKSFIRN